MKPRSAAAAAAASSSSRSARELRSINDVREWLSAEDCASSSIATQSLQEAVAILTSEPTRRRKEDLHLLLSKWSVRRTVNQKNRPLPVLIEELTDAVLEAAKDLQKSFEESAAPHASSSNCSAARDANSGAQLASGSSLLDAPIGNDSLLDEMKARQAKRLRELASVSQEEPPGVYCG